MTIVIACALASIALSLTRISAALRRIAAINARYLAHEEHEIEAQPPQLAAPPCSWLAYLEAVRLLENDGGLEHDQHDIDVARHRAHAFYTWAEANVRPAVDEELERRRG